MSSRIDGRHLLSRLHADFPELSDLTDLLIGQIGHPEPRSGEGSSAQSAQAEPKIPRFARDDRRIDVHAVGGAVRDAILGREAVDIDLACRDARSVATSFRRSVGGAFVELGQQRFATFRVVVGKRIYDFNEIVGQTIEEDLFRRDFTVNAIALELQSSRLVDPAGGVGDLQNRTLRMMREESFRDDPLRVLKGVRMAAALDFSIEPATLAAMERHASAVLTVAAERVAYELDAILSAEERARGLMLLNQLSLDSSILGFSLTPQLIEAVALTGGNDPVVAWAILFFERGSDAVETFAARWRWSERQKRQTLGTIDMASRVRRASHGELPVLIYDFGLDTARRTVQLLYGFELDREADALSEVIESHGERIAATRPLLEGERIQAETGIAPGPEVGRLKREVLEAQLRGEIRSAEEAVALIRAKS